MILSHFSKTLFKFDPDFNYKERTKKEEEKGFIRNLTKPIGLWLSDESDYGWKKWCIENGTETLLHETQFEVDMKKIFHLNSKLHFFYFEEMYANRKTHAEDYQSLVYPIHWNRVQDEWAGILISPYEWDLTFGSHSNWYSGWDCASACIWDLSVLKHLKP